MVIVTEEIVVEIPDNVLSGLNFPEGSVEAQMVKFLASDEFRNATQAQLDDKWFVFSNIDFKFGSANELEAGSQQHLNNVINILKNFNKAKVQVLGFADKVSNNAANMNLSRERAQYIESVLKRNGLSGQVVGFEGFGEEFAKHNVGEANSQRAEDRDIAFCFVK